MTRRGSTLLEATVGLALALLILGMLLTLLVRTASGNVRGQQRLDGVRTRLIARRNEERTARPADAARPLVCRLYRSVVTE